MAAEYGEQHVLLWRRSYVTAPPTLPADAESSQGHLDGGGDVAHGKIACHVHREDAGLAHVP